MNSTILARTRHESQEEPIESHPILGSDDRLMATVPWGRWRAVLDYQRRHAGPQWLRLRIFSKHRTKGYWYPSPRFFVIPMEHAAKLAGVIGAGAARGYKAEASRGDHLNVFRLITPADSVRWKSQRSLLNCLIPGPDYRKRGSRIAKLAWSGDRVAGLFPFRKRECARRSFPKKSFWLNREGRKCRRVVKRPSRSICSRATLALSLRSSKKRVSRWIFAFRHPGPCPSRSRRPTGSPGHKSDEEKFSPRHLPASRDSAVSRSIRSNTQTNHLRKTAMPLLSRCSAVPDSEEAR